MADVVEINSADQLEPYRLAWNALFPQTPRASLFHTIDWVQTYWRRFGHDQKLRLLVIRCAGKPIGIVPLCVRTEHYHVGDVRVLNYPLSDWGVWYGPIGPNPSASLFMAIKHLQNTPRDWDLLDLRWMGIDSEKSDPNNCALDASGWMMAKSDYQETSLIQLEGLDWPTYRAKLSKKWRHELRRQQRNLHHAYRVSVERHRPLGLHRGEGDPRWDLYEDCLTIAAHSWQGESKTGNTLSHSDVRGFLHDCHEMAAKLGMLDMLVLKLDGRPAAFQYNYQYDGSLFGLRMGYHPDFTHCGAGKSLLGWMIEDSLQRGDRVIDMGAGDFPFKRRFRTGTETSQRYTYYPWNAVRSQSVRLTRWIKSHWPVEAAVAKN